MGVRARGATGAGCWLAHVLVEQIRSLLEGHERGSGAMQGDWLSPSERERDPRSDARSASEAR